MKKSNTIGLYLTLLSLFIPIFVCFTQNVKANSYKEGDPYLAFAEVMPEPEGGLPALFKKIEYPDIAKKARIEGKVYALVFVNENGGVDDVKIIKGIGGGCDEAVIKAVKASKFNPGKNGGAAVKVKLSIPVSFKLN